MIHDVLVDASGRYFRYAIYGGTHREAEALALILVSQAGPRPVTISNSAPCSLNSCSKASPLDPYGADGCTCVLLDGHPEVWVIGEGCRWHGTTTKERLKV